MEENKEPTTTEDEDVEAHRSGSEERDRSGSEERNRSGSEEPDFEGHLLGGMERSGSESPELQAGTERPGEI